MYIGRVRLLRSSCRGVHGCPCRMRVRVRVSCRDCGGAVCVRVSMWRGVVMLMHVQSMYNNVYSQQILLHLVCLLTQRWEDSVETLPAQMYNNEVEDFSGGDERRGNQEGGVRRLEGVVGTAKRDRGLDFVFRRGWESYL